MLGAAIFFLFCILFSPGEVLKFLKSELMHSVLFICQHPK